MVVVCCVHGGCGFPSRWWPEFVEIGEGVFGAATEKERGDRSRTGSEMMGCFSWAVAGSQEGGRGLVVVGTEGEVVGVSCSAGEPENDEGEAS
jgi:hypothetical protein